MPGKERYFSFLRSELDLSSTWAEAAEMASERAISVLMLVDFSLLSSDRSPLPNCPANNNTEITRSPLRWGWRGGKQHSHKQLNTITYHTVPPVFQYSPDIYLTFRRNKLLLTLLA